jgi:ABC-2 type transport system permease protein
MIRGFLTITKKDLKAFFLSPIFYTVAFLCTMMLSWVFPIQLSQFSDAVKNMMFQQGMQQQNMNIHFGVFLRQLSYLNLMLIFIVPALTMRLISEEKKVHTFDLLLTSPITSVQIVLGKFVAALGAVFGIVFIAYLYCAWTGFFAKFSWPLLNISFLGIFLVGAVYAAMDLFCSALTESALGSFVMAVILNIAIWFVGIGAEVSDSQTLREFFEHVSLNGHLSAFLEGTVRTSALVFLLSVMGLFVFLAERVVESNRWR